MSQNFDENRKLKVLLLSSVHLIQLTWTWRWVGTCPLATHVVLSGRQGAQGWLCRAVSPWIGDTGRWSAPSIDTRAVRPAGGSEWPVSMPSWLKSLPHVEVSFSVSQVAEGADPCCPLPRVLSHL